VLGSTRISAMSIGGTEKLPFGAPRRALWNRSSPPELHLKRRSVVMTLEEVLVVSCERVADCRDELDPALRALIDRVEDSGYSRKEVLVAVSEMMSEEFASLPDLPRLH
jgi:hypothetical protein